VAGELDEAALRRLFSDISNWGRWGADDQRGTINLIGRQEVLQAPRTVAIGRTVSCARPIMTTAQLVIEAGDEHNSPAELDVVVAGGGVPERGMGMTLDRFSIAAHGSLHTHIDALCHFFFDGLMYNGRTADEVEPSGSISNGVDALGAGICTRGVLLDVAELRGGYVRADEAVHRDELVAAETRAGLTVGRGDAVFVRLGRAVRWVAEGGPECERLAAGGVVPGLHPECLAFLRERDVGLLVSDLGHDQLPARFGLAMPLHIGALVFLGMPLLDGADMEPLARLAAEHSRWEFLLTVAPLAIPGATASLVNPIAIF